jgi:integrase
LFEQRKNADATLAPNTKRYYSDLIKALVKSWPGLKELDMRRLTKHDCILWAGKFAESVSATAYNNAVGIVKSACDIAVEFGARLDNPATSLKRVAPKAKPLMLPTSKQWVRFVEAVGSGGGNRNRYSQPCAFFVQFCAFGGFRKSEAANVLWQDCDFDKGIIVIVENENDETSKDHDFRIKNGQFRVVPMFGDMRRLLEDIKGYNAKLGRTIKPTDKVMEVAECERSMTRACKEVGMARITHHDLRHLFITRCIESGVDMPTISRWVGHSDGGALLMRVYGHLRQEHSLQMAKKVSFTPPQS